MLATGSSSEVSAPNNHQRSPKGDCHEHQEHSSDVGILAASVRAEVGFEVSVSKEATQGSGYHWKVPDDQERGWVERGNNGFDVTWTKDYAKSPCTWVETDSGTALMVTDQKSYIHS